MYRKIWDALQYKKRRAVLYALIPKAAIEPPLLLSFDDEQICHTTRSRQIASGNFDR
jgi:hypothetical protein